MGRLILSLSTARGGLRARSMRIDAEDRPLALKITPGQAHDGSSAADIPAG